MSEISGEVVPFGGKGKVAPPALPQDMINRAGSASSLSTITQANFSPAGYEDVKALLMAGPYFKKAAKLMVSVQTDLDSNTELTREKAYIATTYAPLTEEASIRRFADDLRRYDEEQKRKNYYDAFVKGNMK